MNKKILISALVGAALMTGANAYECDNLAQWDATIAYNGSAKIQIKEVAYQANYWTRGNNPELRSGDYQEWSTLGACDDVIDPPTVPPTVAVTDPVAGDYAEGSQVTLAATASDTDGSVLEVVFQVDGNTIDTLTTAPYSTVWNVTVGSHTITARAKDNDNLTASASVMITGVADGPVNAKPSAEITSPASGDNIAVGDSVVIAANASDTDGTISQVEFFVEGISIAVDTTSPYTTNWQAETAGNVVVSAVAKDNLAALSDSSFVTVTVGGDVPPSTSNCQPEGLYQTPGLTVPYCSIYDDDGREKLGANHKRRIIGYFTSWRNGANGQPMYLASDIPWQKLTHINYAFAHINEQNQVSIGDVNDPANPATGMTWPGVTGAEMDPSLPYKGHFNLLNKYKKQFPHVKTLVSIGGWAETGGFFDDTGKRIANGGFYSMTTNADGSVNTAGINTFAASAVNFIRSYGFDGVDIDYEYPSSMTGAGNPDDYWFSDNHRGNLWASYQVLMKTLREELDKASAADGTHYMLTIASPSSAYLLRGMEDFDVTPYLDYVNIMSYDLHGAWNSYVGHNAALYDTGLDLELEEGNVYGTAQYGKIGYLNTDWAVHYFRGAVPAGRLNIGVPYYTRGWQGVAGGTNGLWGKAALPVQAQCPTGTGTSTPCGYGALGLNNLWHDKDTDGNELGAGSNPMWHAKNLEKGIAGSYLQTYGFPTETELSGTYQRHYDSVAQSPWLWNAQDKVFISTEDEQSMAAKVQYVIDQEVGGIMFWELAGDYQWYPERNGGAGEYFIGDTLTSIAFNAFASAPGYGVVTADNIAEPTETVSLSFDFDNYKVGDSNYPLNPKLRLTNTGTQAIPGGTSIEFNMPTATSSIISDQSGVGLSVISDGSNPAGNNIAGLKNNFHRVRLTLPAWQQLDAGGVAEITMNFYLPVPRATGLRVIIGSNQYGASQEYPNLPVADLSTGSGSDGGGDGSSDGSSNSCNATGVAVYPNWPQVDWQGNPSHAASGDKMLDGNSIWKANWYTKSIPGSDGSWALVCQLAS